MHSLKKERFKTLSDLHDIYDYIAFNLLASDVARNTTDRILEAVRTLQTMPERNPLYKEEPWHSQGVRFIPVKNDIVFYTVKIQFLSPASCTVQETSPISLLKPTNGDRLSLS